jgi:fructose/tagatose bisphosphate aldolase
MVLSSSREFSSYVSTLLNTNTDGSVTIIDEAKLLSEGIDRLVFTSALSEDSALRHEARVLIRKIGEARGVHSASIYELYKAIGGGEVSGFSLPAMNIRMMNYDFSRAIFDEAQKMEAGALIFEIARSEMKYCAQNPDEFSASVIAGAIKSGYEGAVFIQGDHFQFKEDKFKTNPQEEIDSIKLLIKDSLMAQFYNIDIDASTLVDLDKEELFDQQKDNFEMTAELTKYIRGIQPPGVTVAIGGEIGHIGGKNSTVEDFEAFMEGYLGIIGNDMKGITKVSVQTGTSHGGIPDENGKVIEVPIDFNVLKSISESARSKYKIAGPVQHGASTLPERMFSEFVKNDTAEVHLATELMNIMIDNLPEELREKMHQWTMENCTDEREEKWNDAQFVYKLRKKAVGPFKKDCWNLSEDDRKKVREALGVKLRFLFESFNIAGTAHTVRKYIA